MHVEIINLPPNYQFTSTSLHLVLISNAYPRTLLNELICLVYYVAKLCPSKKSTQSTLRGCIPACSCNSVILWLCNSVIKYHCENVNYWSDLFIDTKFYMKEAT